MLLACLMMAALWVESYWHARGFRVAKERYASKQWRESSLTVGSDYGGIDVYWSVATATESEVEWGEFPERVGNWHIEHWPYETSSGYPCLKDDFYPGHQWLGFMFGSSNEFEHATWRHGYQWQLIVPYPAIWLPCGLVMTGFGRRWLRQRRRILTGRCLQCGYDLRAHAPGQNCPECGTLVPMSPPDAP